MTDFEWMAKHTIVFTMTGREKNPLKFLITTKTLPALAIPHNTANWSRIRHLVWRPETSCQHCDGEVNGQSLSFLLLPFIKSNLLVTSKLQISDHTLHLHNQQSSITERHQNIHKPNLQECQEIGLLEGCITNWPPSTISAKGCDSLSADMNINNYASQQCRFKQ
jgi:hypothetical protein